MNSRAQRLIGDARGRNSKRDKMDRSQGLAAPSDCPIDIHAATVRDAMQAGLMMADWTIVAEAFCMAEDLVKRMKAEAAE